MATPMPTQFFGEKRHGRPQVTPMIDSPGRPNVAASQDTNGWTISKDETLGSSEDGEYETFDHPYTGASNDDEDILVDRRDSRHFQDNIIIRRTSPRSSKRPSRGHGRYDRPPTPPPWVRGFISNEKDNAAISDSISEQSSASRESRSRPQTQTKREGSFALTRKKKNGRTLEALLDQIEELNRENERLRTGPGRVPTPPPAVPSTAHQIFYCVKGSYYLDEPRWVPGQEGHLRPQLSTSNPIRSIDHYLGQHPELAFVFFNDYSPEAPSRRSKFETSDGVYRVPVPDRQCLALMSSSMKEAVERVVERVPEFEKYFPDFDVAKEIKAPYLFMYYSQPHISNILPKLSPLNRSLFERLYKTIEASHGYEHSSARHQFGKGLVARHLVKYLIKPGDVLVEDKGSSTQAYVALDWAEEKEPPLDGHPDEYERYDPFRKKKSPQVVQTYAWTVPAWYWMFDGQFEEKQILLRLHMKATYEEETVNITDLNVVPLEYGPYSWQTQLESRGEMFWKLRFKKFVSYHGRAGDELSNIDERYMVDTSTFKALHPNSKLAKLHLRPSLSLKEMENDQPPAGNALLVFPTVIPGYNLQHKKWVNIYVDQISEIVWNKQAFKDLVVDEEIKEMVQALVTNQVVASKSTDLISSKGNGLIILLHGAPGTGKTFTAEGVAEFAEKPLFRVTCSDVGTGAEIVEHRLDKAFRLGKAWDCVVLLDEADVFLEERDMKDLNRNALVSVFLRALEYHNGILVLTSNRVGTFDEAFKSRIQLALHYENLNVSQRRKIWRNFINRLKALNESNVDFDDLFDHIDDLAQQDMNGREIRNAITTAR